MSLGKDTPLGFTYPHPADGGLGIPCLRTTIPRLRAKQMRRQAEAEDKDLQVLEGHPDFQFPCDAGCNARETLGHHVQSCTRTHDERVKRHNNVDNWVSQCLTRKVLIAYTAAG